jgi:hypothetical protein
LCLKAWPDSFCFPAWRCCVFLQGHRSLVFFMYGQQLWLVIVSIH